ncbi:universal stress protein (plasmid) [Pseudonocardia bannensis]|uniref:Universal stress protein n=1 Tax=Pseudonocardia bannensis TaxID=630973 RepID=A0A848DQH8_9PSEU|nr:universal stress protein [Pseudonocardia bannensis]NMH94968.1 universal stress protein [Pseudonocardia bannensis]
MATPPGADPQSQGGRIVVGVDGSPGSLAALRWAVREASIRGLAVHAVTAWEFPVESTFGDMRTDGDFHPVITAEKILVSALADTGVAADDDTISTAPVKGHPAEVLMQVAAGAELLVVGSRGYGRIFGALLGSVSHYVAAHAACPVVVIKPVANGTGRRSRSGP